MQAIYITAQRTDDGTPTGRVVAVATNYGVMTTVQVHGAIQAGAHVYTRNGQYSAEVLAIKGTNTVRGWRQDHLRTVRSSTTLDNLSKLMHF